MLEHVRTQLSELSKCWNVATKGRGPLAAAAKGGRASAAPTLWNPLWLCSYVAMWLCGYVAM